MAEAVIERCRGAGLIESAERCRTMELPLVGAPATVNHRITDPPGAHLYGTEAALLDDLPGHEREMGMGLTEAMVRFAVRFEGARTVEDVLARRSRILFLDAQLAEALADDVAAIVAEELGGEVRDTSAFKQLARRYHALPG